MRRTLLSVMLLCMTALTTMAQGIVVHHTDNTTTSYKSTDVKRLEFTTDNVQTTTGIYATKSELKDVRDALEANLADKTTLNLKADKTALNTLADKTALDVKADKTALDAKADKTELEAKADATALNNLADKTALEAKADKTALDAKADKTALDAKADKTALDAKADMTELEAKADKTAVDKKADKTALQLAKERLAVLETLAPLVMEQAEKLPKVPYSDAVDLGLSVMWASYNVGATKPEEFGEYYAWGETEVKEDYTWKTYKWCNGAQNKLNKYNFEEANGTVDNKTVLDIEDDVAHVKWSGDWRMPTLDEFTELINNCDRGAAQINGVSGYKFTSRINGNYIFLPRAGYINGRYMNTNTGSYWTKSLYPVNCPTAGSFDYTGSRVSSTRYSGLTVRPVCPKVK